MPETSKTKTVALLLIIGAVIIILAGAGLVLLSLSSLSSGGTVPAAAMQYLFLGIAGIAVGVFDFAVSNSLHRLKKWAYIAAFVQFALAGAGNIIMLAAGNFSIITALALMVNGLLITLLYLDKDTFFKQPTP